MTMQATELRIGNLIQGVDNTLPFEVLGIKRKKLLMRAWSGANQLFPIDRFTGIPLTEEWLVRLGITNGEFLQWSIQKHADGYLIYRGHGCMHVVIKHVHQLQNLFFALTGKELEAK